MSVVTLLLLLVAMGVGIFFYRRKKSKPVSENTQDEEEVLEEEEEEEMDAADMIAVEKKADIAIQETKRKASVAASMAKKKETEAAAALAAKKKAEAEVREAKRKKDAQAALIAKKKAEAAAALAAKKKAEAEAYKRKLAKAREEKRKAEAARKAREEAERKRKAEAARKEAARKAREEARKRREAAEKARKEREAASKKLQKQHRELNNLLYNAKQEEKTCTDGSWNGVNLTDTWGYYIHRDVELRTRWDKTYFAFLGRFGRKGNIEIKFAVPKYGGNAPRRFKHRKNKKKTTTTIYHRGSAVKTFNGQLYMKKGELKIIKYKSPGRNPYYVRPHHESIARFDMNRGDKCAVVMVSPRGKPGQVLFIKSNSTKSYDLINGKWIDHPYPKCTTKEDLLKKYCDTDITNPKPRCPPGYDGQGLGNLFARTELCPPGRTRLVDERTGKTRGCRASSGTSRGRGRAEF